MDELSPGHRRGLAREQAAEYDAVATQQRPGDPFGGWLPGLVDCEPASSRRRWTSADDRSQAGKAVGLYSMVEKDSLMYESRDWGINLKWFKDSGKYQTYSGILKAGGTLKEVYNGL